MEQIKLDCFDKVKNIHHAHLVGSDAMIQVLDNSVSYFLHKDLHRRLWVKMREGYTHVSLSVTYAVNPELRARLE